MSDFGCAESICLWLEWLRFFLDESPRRRQARTERSRPDYAARRPGAGTTPRCSSACSIASSQFSARQFHFSFRGPRRGRARLLLRFRLGRTRGSAVARSSAAERHAHCACTVKKNRISAAHQTDAERHRRLVAEDFTGILVMRTDGQIVSCNPAVVSIFGFDSAEEAQSANFFSFLRTRQDGIELLEMVRQHEVVDRHELE